MPDKLEEARSLLQNRLAELEREREQLTAAIRQLDALIKRGAANGAATSTRSRAKPRTRSRGSSKGSAAAPRKRARRGQREKQLLSSIEAHPDYRVSDHAREVGVSPQQLYPLLNRLLAKEAVVKKDSRYVVKA